MVKKRYFWEENNFGLKNEQNRLGFALKPDLICCFRIMELSQGTHDKASNFAPQDVDVDVDVDVDLDFISSMPDIVVTNILDRLPIKDAVRTGILSRNWRFKWNMVSQLVFDENFFKCLLKTEGEKDIGRIISRLLFHIKGAITKFVLFIDELGYSVDVEDISHWILFLSRKGVKDLTLERKILGTPLKLHSHLFSCLALKHLKLAYYWLDPPANFRGFPNLLSLEYCLGNIESGKFGEFLTRCPNLEILKLGFTLPRGKVKLVEISKLTNLRILSLSMCNLDNTRSASTIFELVVYLPKLQELHLDFLHCKLTEDGAKKRLPTTLPCLKTLKLLIIDLGDDNKLSCAFEMIRSFPDLQTLEITTTIWDAVPPPAICSLEVDYSTMVPLQLRSVVFGYSKGSENELFLLKYLLACSPFLKNIFIRPFGLLESDEKLMFSRKLLKLYRASPLVVIDLY